MAMEQFYKEFMSMSPEQQELFKTILTIMKSDDDLNFKTEIPNPSLHSAMDVYAVYLKDIGLKDASKYLKLYSKTYKEQMVSDKRKGRIEFKDMISAGIQSLYDRARSFGDRITGRNKE